jgi:4-cresol dehydrogenase (hydroxylating)
MPLPSGVVGESFADAIGELESAVGKEWVFTGDDDVALYRDAYSPFWGEDEERLASAAVAPDSVEQVQKVVSIANARRIPLYTVSTGRNLAYGGSAPVYSGCVVLDLRRMNRILEVNERNAYALVEPGVTYFDLYRHIRQNRLKLWVDVPDPGWGSLVGNSLEHGAGYTGLPYRDHFDAHCGMEVVLANGEVMRTGMGALPGSQTWQQFKYGMGPIVDGLFAQSNFGVVTKMGFWLMAQPQAYRAVTVTVPRYSDIVPFVDIMSRLMHEGVLVSQTRIYSDVFHGPRDPQLVGLLTGAERGTPEQFDSYAKAKGLKYWTGRFTFHGPQKVIDAQWEHVRDSFSAIAGVAFAENESYRFPLSDEQVEKVTDPAPIGIPSLAVFGMGLSPNKYVVDNGHMDFSPVVSMTGETILELIHVFARAFVELGVEPSVGWPQCYHPRALTVIHSFPITHDAEQNRKTRAAFARMIEIAAEHGWGEYRVHAVMQDKAIAAYSFNNHVLHRFHETLKDAVDPNGILSPGRYGIWPKHLRGTRT